MRDGARCRHLVGMYMSACTQLNGISLLDGGAHRTSLSDGRSQSDSADHHVKHPSPAHLREVRRGQCGECSSRQPAALGHAARQVLLSRSRLSHRVRG